MFTFMKDRISKKIIEIISKEADVSQESVHLNDKLVKNLGANIRLEINDTFDMDIKGEEMHEAKTVGDIINLVQGKLDENKLRRISLRPWWKFMK